VAEQKVWICTEALLPLLKERKKDGEVIKNKASSNLKRLRDLLMIFFQFTVK
jgi:hypothetical protein